jgi:hypothetical protein
VDQSKKTMRHFYCRDVLWETFEQMANDFDCSIDYLVNEAMRYYARSKNYQSVAGMPAQGGAPAMPAGGRRPTAATQSPVVSDAQAMGRPAPALAPGALPPPRRSAAVPATQPPPGYAAQGYAAPAAMPSAPPAMPAPMAPPPHAGSNAAATAPLGPGAGSTLFLLYNGQRYPVTKDQFIIGRGSKTSDLPIKDGNISRKHCAVIRRNGTFYIKDLGSTNGIDFKGMRIDNKRIDEGDVFHLCDYELRFTYRAE